MRITHEALVRGDGSRRAHRPRGDSETRRIAAVIFDFGDTLADETTEEKDSHQVTQRARLWCRLSERYPTAPKDESEVPRHEFSDFARLPGLIKAIEDLQGERVTGWRSPS